MRDSEGHSPVYEYGIKGLRYLSAAGIGASFITMGTYSVPLGLAVFAVSGFFNSFASATEAGDTHAKANALEKATKMHLTEQKQGLVQIRLDKGKEQNGPHQDVLSSKEEQNDHDQKMSRVRGLFNLFTMGTIDPERLPKYVRPANLLHYLISPLAKLAFFFPLPGWAKIASQIAAFYTVISTDNIVHQEHLREAKSPEKFNEKIDEHQVTRLLACPSLCLAVACLTTGVSSGTMQIAMGIYAGAMWIHGVNLEQGKADKIKLLKGGKRENIWDLFRDIGIGVLNKIENFRGYTPKRKVASVLDFTYQTVAATATALVAKVVEEEQTTGSSKLGKGVGLAAISFAVLASNAECYAALQRLEQAQQKYDEVTNTDIKTIGNRENVEMGDLDSFVKHIERTTNHTPSSVELHNSRS